MPNPKRKHSKSRGRKRRTHKKISFPSLASCSHCRRLKPTHIVCPFCGYYKDKEVIEIKIKEKKKKTR